jgi:hypothetical protein
MPILHQTETNAVVSRLRHSRNESERDSIFVGRTLDFDQPVLIDRNLLLEHMHIIGPTGTGKTTRALITQSTQMIAQNTGPLVIIDMKGDPAYFHAARHAAQTAGRTFKWFTNKPDHSTYVFNPWRQKSLRSLSLSQLVGLISQSLNLRHGQDYGRAWFSMLAYIQARRAIQRTGPSGNQRRNKLDQLIPSDYPIESFAELRDLVNEVNDADSELAKAQHLAYVLECLAEFEQLNLAPGAGVKQSAIDHAIHMPDVIRNKEVVYFYLESGIDLSSVGELAQLAIYSLFVAAGDYLQREGVVPRIYTIWDEAQVLITQNIEPFLTQARSAGMGCILSHQHLNQLNPPGGVDLRETVLGNTAVKQVFAANDPWLMDYIQETSGQAKYYDLGYEISSRALGQGQVHAGRSLIQLRSGLQHIQVKEHVGPRITVQDILNVSRDPNINYLWITRNEGLSRFRGWFPMITGFPMTKENYVALQRTPWPDATEATITTRPFWPDEDAKTITVESHPELTHPASGFSDEQANEMLKKLKRPTRGPFP